MMRCLSSLALEMRVEEAEEEEAAEEEEEEAAAAEAEAFPIPVLGLEGAGAAARPLVEREKLMCAVCHGHQHAPSTATRASLPAGGSWVGMCWVFMWMEEREGVCVCVKVQLTPGPCLPSQRGAVGGCGEQQQHPVLPSMTLLHCPVPHPCPRTSLPPESSSLHPIPAQRQGTDRDRERERHTHTQRERECVCVYVDRWHHLGTCWERRRRRSWRGPKGSTERDQKKKVRVCVQERERGGGGRGGGEGRSDEQPLDLVP